MAITETSDGVADGMIRSFFERWQRLEEEKANIADDLKELFAEARGNGLDAKALRAVFREQVGDKVARDEFDAICDLYRASLTAPRAHPAPAHEKTLNNLASYAEATGREPTVSKIEKVQPETATQSQAKASEDNGRISGGAAPVTGEVSRLASGRTDAATSEIKDVTAGETAPIPDEGIPAFLKRENKPLRPHCLNPGLCAGSGSKHCYGCLKARDDASVAA